MEYFNESISVLANIIFTFRGQDLMISNEVLYMYMVQHFNAD